MNKTAQSIVVITELSVAIESQQQPPFLVAGEMISKLNLMPNDDGYVLRYNIFPQQLGNLALPKLSISDI
jgi:hypothetical protein